MVVANSSTKRRHSKPTLIYRTELVSRFRANRDKAHLLLLEPPGGSYCLLVDFLLVRVQVPNHGWETKCPKDRNRQVEAVNPLQIREVRFERVVVQDIQDPFVAPQGLLNHGLNNPSDGPHNSRLENQITDSKMLLSPQ